jgi:hypothetical protein
MAKVSQEPLQPNPFQTYRDPLTGKWLVISHPKEAKGGASIAYNHLYTTTLPLAQQNLD